MICENTISAGFYFMLGRFLFDLTVVVSVIGVIAIIWLLMILYFHWSKK